jgi:DNA-directed RNA polymerase subunit RPC12/RpoP
MLQSYECFSCRKVSLFSVGEDQTKCPTCGSTNIQILSKDRVTEGMKAGVYFNIDPKTGKRAKTKK